MMTMTMITT